MDSANIINALTTHYRLSVKGLSDRIGLDRPQALYDIQKGKTKSITSKMADKICTAFPELSRAWLLTGEGEMLRSSGASPSIITHGHQSPASIHGDVSVTAAPPPLTAEEHEELIRLREKLKAAQDALADRERIIASQRETIEALKHAR